MTTSHHRQQRRPLHRLATAGVNILLLAITLAGLAYLAPTVLGYERYVITGGSMSGTFEKGSIAFEKPTPVDQLTIGDIITYQPPADSGVTTLVTHRIVSIKTLADGRLSYRTQGDANPDPDPWRFQLTATTQPVVQHTVPHAGWMFIALADRTTRIIAIGIPATLIALASLAELVTTLRREPEVEPFSAAAHA